MPTSSLRTSVPLQPGGKPIAILSLRMAKRLGAVALGGLVALVALEIVLRTTMSADEIASRAAPVEPSEAGRWTDHPFLPFVGQPNAEYIVSGTQWGKPFQGRVKNNSMGFRTHELPAAKPAGAYFVVTLGGSTTWGALAASNEDTWPALLERRLQQHHPNRDIRVFNLGTQNVTLPYSVTALALTATQLEPDLVIVYHGINDSEPSFAKGYRPDHAHFFRDLAIAQRWHGFQASLPTWLRASYGAVYLASLADGVIGANRLTFYVNRLSVFDADLAVVSSRSAMKAALMRNWRHFSTIDALARGYGGRALFSTFQFFDGDRRGHREVNESLRAFFALHELPYVDQDSLIADGDQSLQFDECHFTEAGRRLIAENFFRAIVERGWLEAAAARWKVSRNSGYSRRRHT